MGWKGIWHPVYPKCVFLDTQFFFFFSRPWCFTLCHTTFKVLNERFGIILKHFTTLLASMLLFSVPHPGVFVANKIDLDGRRVVWKEKAEEFANSKGLQYYECSAVSLCDIIQILTGTVMKYHVSVDCQESYIFPKCAAPTCDISSFPVNICYITWSKFDGALWLPRSLVTRLGVCVQNKLNANFTSLRAFYYDVLLLTTVYSACTVHFFLGQFPNMELMLLLSPLFLMESLYYAVGRSI